MLFDKDPEMAEAYPYMNMYTAYLRRMQRELVGREHEMEQVQAAMLKPEYCNVLLLAEAGAGKAQPNDTWIPVADGRGYARLGDIKPGDRVFNEEGEPVEVIGVFPQGPKRVFEVAFTDGTKTECNDEHLWNARRRSAHHESGPYGTHTLRDMIDRDIIRYGKRSKRKPVKKHMWYVPSNRAVSRPAKDLPIDPYALGALIGDGCLTEPGLAASSNDEQVIAKIAGAIGAKSYARRSEANYTWDFYAEGTDDGHRKRIHTADMAKALGDDNTVFGFKSIDRRIPRAYMTGSIEQRTELLRGLMDTDGSLNGSEGRVNASFSTNSQGLALDVRELAASLGFRTTLNDFARNDDTHANMEYSVHFAVSDDTAETLFSLDRHIAKIGTIKRNDKKFHKHYDDVAIESVTDTGRDAEMTCIYVDCDSHLYQTGKEHIVTHNTALVQGIMAKDAKRTYLEVDLSKMIANLKNENEMADRLKTLFDEVSKYRKQQGKEIVLFIDEFHQIVQLSPAAVEVLKPLLADSGTRGIRVIAATTHVEYQQFIAPNLPLVERLQRIKLVQPGEDVVVAILKGMCERYGVEPYKETLYHLIYEYTNRYIPATSQPRKSILIMDSMIGWHRLTGKPLDKRLLADVIYETEGINVAFRVDASTIKKKLDEKVLAQQVATTSIEQRLQICVAGLNNQNRPMSSFLFTGSTGVGKRLPDDVMIPVWTEGGSVTIKRNGDLKPGDYVFNRKGEPVRVSEVFHFKDCRMLEVELTDGRKIQADPEHLWQYKSRSGNGSKAWKVADTQTIMNKNFSKYHNAGRSAANVKFVIPMNQAVQWPERKYEVHPYVIGVILGNGCCAESALSISSIDRECIERCNELIKRDTAFRKQALNYTWHFYDIDGETLKTKDLLSSVPEIIGCRAGDKAIPDAYKYGSIEQRWELVRGLFDTDGAIDRTSGRYNVSYSTTSKQLAEDIQHVLYSLGVSSSISRHARSGKSDEYDVHVKINNADKEKFFFLERKKSIARDAKAADAGKARVKKFGDVIGIRDIRETNTICDATCIMVDDDEHLYQAGDFIVTHNTETTKQLAAILYDDDRNLIRFDMTEYALPESLTRFRRELTNKVSTIPYSIVLLDEIEKACAPVTRLLLQVLDDGRLLDENEREVTFKNTYIIITTNAGNEVYKTMSSYDQSDKPDFKTVEKYDKLIRESIISQSGSKFPPELLGRIDCIVPFQPLSKRTMMGIVQMKLKSLAANVQRKHNVTIHVHKNLFLYLIYDKLDSDSDSGGARIVVSKLERELTVPLSRYINEHPQEKEVWISISGKMAIMDKRKLESEAYVFVGDHYCPDENKELLEKMRQQFGGIDAS